MDLREKVAIVTGGVKGIGKSLVGKLIDEGAVLGVVDMNAAGLERLSRNNQNVYCVECDLTSHEEVEVTVNKFYEKFGRIDILVNNAGILHSEPLVSLTPGGTKKHSMDMWEKVISTDLSSVFYITANVVEKMIVRRTKGVIANISSVCASGNAGQSAYSAAKAGVNALTATWAKELSPLGIRVIAIAPGYTDTESTRRAVKEAAIKEVVKKVPLRRLGKPDEIADGIVSVIKNDFFNSKVFQLDGGLVI
jgi:3-oxoacyl-[acyl-carrier protein] reductase